MKRILVTGGAGFIGSHVIDALLRHGYKVSVLDKKGPRQATNLQPVMGAVHYHHGNIENEEAVKAAMKGCDTVLHLAAEVSVPKSFAEPLLTHNTNVMGTRCVFEVARRAVKRVVYASSAAVYGDAKVVPTPESYKGIPLSPYAAHKEHNEVDAYLCARDYGMSMVGLRFFNVYGSRQDPSSPYSGVISIFANKMQAGEAPTIYGDGSATRDFIHVSDVAQACIAALEADESVAPIYNVATGSTITIRQLVASLNQVLGTCIEPRYTFPREGDIVHSCAINTELQALIDINRLTPIEVGLRETLGLKNPR